ncbi:MAG: hypothetical protein ACLU9S_02050 [Oscillospiraceae bacterium]
MPAAPASAVAEPGGAPISQHVYRKDNGRGACEGYKYYLLDADGTEHYFYFKDANGNATASGKDEDGLGYTLTDTGTGDAKYVITDKDGGKMQFWASGKRGDDPTTQTGTSLRVTYNARDRLINTVYDGAGPELLLFLQRPPALSHIKDSRNRQTTYNCDGDNLVKITYPDGAVSGDGLQRRAADGNHQQGGLARSPPSPTRAAAPKRSGLHLLRPGHVRSAPSIPSPTSTTRPPSPATPGTT